MYSFWDLFTFTWLLAVGAATVAQGIGRLSNTRLKALSTRGIAGSSSVNNVPFFPRSIEELASDASFQTKIALISNLRRVRIDLSTRMTQRTRQVLGFLLTYTKMLLDEETTHIHVFVSEQYSVERTKLMWEEMVTKQELNNELETQRLRDSLTISGIGDSFLAPVSFDSPRKAKRGRKPKTKSAAQEKDNESEMLESSSPQTTDDVKTPRAFVIFHPNNVLKSNSTSSLLEEVEALCFHAALRGIPVVLINPTLVSTAWSDCGLRDSMLLGDFSQCYYVCDDYMMLERKGRYCGLVQRAATGFDLFLLDGLFTSGAPANVTRLQSWENGFPSNMRGAVAEALLNEGGIKKTLKKLQDDDILESRRTALETVRLDAAIKKELQRKSGVAVL